MGDLDEIITTFPPSKTWTGKTKHNRTKKKLTTTEKQTNKQTRTHRVLEGRLYGSHGSADRARPTVCTSLGRLG